MATANLLQAVETRREVSAVDRFIADITQKGIEAQIKSERRAERLSADKRHLFLIGVEKKYAPDADIADGMIGGMQVFASLARPEQAIHLRATYLAMARIAQIDGNHARVRAMLRKARSFRSAK